MTIEDAHQQGHEQGMFIAYQRVLKKLVVIKEPILQELLSSKDGQVTDEVKAKLDLLETINTEINKLLDEDVNQGDA